MRTMRVTRAIALASALAACSHGGSGFVPVATTGAAPFALQRPDASTGTVDTVVVIPAKTSALRPRYVSPSTNSMKIVVYDKTHTKLLSTQLANLAASSPLCKKSTSGRTCNAHFDVPAGTDRFDVWLYDKPNATGNALSALTHFPLAVVAGKTQTLSMTLGGLATNIAIVATPSAGLSGKGSAFAIVGSQQQTLTIVPLDADGHFIVGPGAPGIAWPVPPANVTVTKPDATHPNLWTLASSYQATNPTVPAHTQIAVQTVPVPYSGGSVVKKVASLALYQPWIYVMNDYGTGATAVTAYDEDGNPKTLTGTWGGLTESGWGVYSASNKQLYITQYDQAGKIFAYDAMGNVQATGGFPNTVYPGQPALDTQNQQLYVPNYEATTSGWVTAYDLQGNQRPLSNTAFAPMQSGGFVMTYDAVADTIFGINYLNGVMAGYDASGTTMTSGGFSGVADPYSMTIDTANGNVVVANSTSSPGAITVYDAKGNPVNSSGGFPGLLTPYGIAYDPYNDRFYVEDNGAAIKEFDGKGNALTLAAGAFPNLDYPLGVIVVP